MRKKGFSLALLILAALTLLGIPQNCMAEVTYSFNGTELSVTDPGFNLSMEFNTNSVVGGTISYNTGSGWIGVALTPSGPFYSESTTISDLGPSFNLNLKYTLLNNTTLYLSTPEVYIPSGGSSAIITWSAGGSYVGTTVSLTNGVAQAPVPIPPSAALLGSGLLGLVGFGLRRQRQIR
jgi:hypothetical protein